MRLTDLFLGNHQITEQNPAVQGQASAAAPRPQEQGGNTRLQNLTPGQIIRGELISMDNGGVQIKLLNNLLLNAKLDQNIMLEPEKVMNFQVRSNGKSLMLTPLQANLSVEGPVSKALEMAELPVNSATGEMTKLMMRAGMPIDRNSLQQMYREMINQPAGQISDLVDLHKLGLPVTEENLTQMSSYKNLTHQLTFGLTDTAQALMESISGMQEDGNSPEAAKLYLELATLLEEAEPGADAVLKETDSSAIREVFDRALLRLTGESMGETGILQEPEDLENLQNAQIFQDIQISEDTQSAQNAQASQSVQSPQNPESAVQDRNAMGDGRVLISEVSGELHTEAVKSTVIAEKPQSEKGTDTQGSGASPEPAGRDDQGEKSAFPSGMQYSRIFSRVLQSPEFTQDQKLDLVNQLIKQGLATKNRNLTDALMSSPHVKRLLSDRFEKQWSITPEQVADPKEVERLYGRLERQLSGVMRALESAGQDHTPAFQNAANLNQNLDFLNQINQMYSYVQLPLRLQQGKAQGDLYVYTNKRNLASREGPITALLHLDMEHLGPLDVYVSMQTEKVNTRFSVRDEEMLDFLEDHMHILTERLEKRGYRMSVQTSLKSREKEEKNSGIDPILEQAAPGVLLQVKGFDVRT